MLLYRVFKLLHEVKMVVSSAKTVEISNVLNSWVYH